MSDFLTKDQIFASSGRRYEIVEIDGGKVRIRSLTGAEWEDYENSLYHQVKRGDGALEVKLNNRHKRAKLAVLCVCDAGGQPVFGPADVIRLSGIDAGALDRIYEACMRINGADAEADKDADDFFGETPDGPSTTVSPSPSAAAPSPNSWPAPAPSS